MYLASVMDLRTRLSNIMNGCQYPTSKVKGVFYHLNQAFLIFLCDYKKTQIRRNVN